MREKYPSVSLKLANKMRILGARAYITEGVILTLKPLFYVPKGKYDIHMLFYAMVSGLNDSIWDTNFMLPSIVSLIMIVSLETYMVDLDVRETFYNF